MRKNDMPKKILMISLLAALCAPSIQALADEKDSNEATLPEKKSSRGIARGLMLFNKDRMIFSPCRDRSYNAVDDTSADGATGQALKNLGLADGVPLYIEVYGESAGGMLRMRELNMAQRDARCYAPRRTTGEWRAAGEQPTWALTVFEGSATLQQVGQADLVATAQETTSPDIVEISLQGASTAKISLRKQLCHDKEKQRIYGWTAEIQRPEGKLSGCAWRQ